MDYFDEKTRGGGSKELNSGPLGVTCPPPPHTLMFVDANEYGVIVGGSWYACICS